MTTGEQALAYLSAAAFVWLTFADRHVREVCAGFAWFVWQMILTAGVFGTVLGLWYAIFLTIG